MRTGQKIIGTLLVLAVLLSVTVTIINVGNDDEVFSANLYFINENSTSISVEARDIKFDEESELPDRVLDALRRGPAVSGSLPIMSKNTEWTISRESTRLTVDFTQDFLTTDNTKNLLATYAVVKSLCSVDNVTSVKVTVAGGELVAPDNSRIDYLADRDINLETDTNTSDNRNIKLYFVAEDGQLDAQWRNVKITDTVPIEQYVVTELIKGTQKEGLSATLSPDTKLISVEVTDGTAYINMTGGFIDKHKGTPEKEQIAVYSIVNSVTEIEGINNVQFLIDGKKAVGFETIDLTTPVERNELIIKQ